MNLNSHYWSVGSKRAAWVTIVLLLAVTQWSVAQAPPPVSKNAAATKKEAERQPALHPPLTAGMTAFVRVRQYSILSAKPTVEDSAGGTGYVLKNLIVGLQSPIVEPSPDDVTFSFGEAVTLVEKKDGLPTMWVVGKGQTGARSALPAYLLTSSKAEIDLLKKIDRIPNSMTLFYKDEHYRVWGSCLCGVQRAQVIDSHGLVLLGYPKGTSPFAIKGNAVVFDSSVVKTEFDNPLVFDGNNKPLQMTSSSMYYCLSDGAKPAFERIQE